MQYCFILFSILVTNYGSGLLLTDGIIKPMFLRDGIRANCITESGATEVIDNHEIQNHLLYLEDIAEIRAHTFATRRTGQCLLSCILKRIGIGIEDVKSMTENIGLSILGNLQRENPLLHKRVLPVMLRCQSEVDAKNPTDTCDFVLQLASCAMKEGVTNVLEVIFLLIKPPGQGLIPFNGALSRI